MFFQDRRLVGEVSLALILGFVYLLIRSYQTSHSAYHCGYYRCDDGDFQSDQPDIYTGPLFNIFTGGVCLSHLYGNRLCHIADVIKGMVIYSIGIGVITVLIRYLSISRRNFFRDSHYEH